MAMSTLRAAVGLGQQLLKIARERGMPGAVEPHTPGHLGTVQLSRRSQPSPPGHWGL
jgi:hypothetical protein